MATAAISAKLPDKAAGPLSKAGDSDGFVHVPIDINSVSDSGSGSDSDWDQVSSFKVFDDDFEAPFSPVPSIHSLPNNTHATINMSDWNSGPTNYNDQPAGGGWDDPQAGSTAAYDNFGTQGGGGDDFGASNDNYGGGYGGDDDRACHHCGQAGHMKADCPDKPPMVCNGCGQPGHIRRECPDAPAMTCNICGSPDHMRRECPDKPAESCRNCGEEGHRSAACESERRLIDRSEIPDVPEDQVWKEIQEAISDRDTVELKDCLNKLFKAQPDMTYIQLENIFREKNLKVWIIAMERNINPSMLLMDLQGNLNRQWAISYRFSPKADRPKDFDAWPKTLEENLERIANAGEPVPNHRPRCLNCKELGHVSKYCEMEKIEPENKATIRCYNCDSEGHRVRDCPQPRQDRNACRNCKQSGHKASECTEPRNADDVECNKCHEMGHFSRDCPQGGGDSRACRNCGGEGHMARDCTEPRKVICRNCDEEGHMSAECSKPRRMQCRNCDEYGHTSRQCPQPEDLSKFKCNNCGEMGHKKMQCPNPTQTDIDGPGYGGGDGYGGSYGHDGNNDDFGNAGGDDNYANNTGTSGW